MDFAQRRVAARAWLCYPCRVDTAARARPLPDLDQLVAGVERGDRTALGRAITLVESKNASHRELATRLLQRLAPRTGHATRIGITGVPGVGKSTLIDAFGSMLTSLGHKVAVLAVDPSSERSGGSILGDKTRMQRLANDERAFVRPSPAGGTLGGVAARTREAMLVLEAAGHDILIVETVGVGQSETAVKRLTDTFVLLALAGAGDELQGVKRGIMEMADLVLVTKCDGDNALPAQRAAASLKAALRLLFSDALHAGGWVPPVLTTSATAPLGLEAAWDGVRAHRQHLERHGELTRTREAQAVDWMWTLVRERLERRARQHPDLAAIELAVRTGALGVEDAARRLTES